MEIFRYQYHDGGRSDAGYKGLADDCACRAIAIATNIPYQDAYDLIKTYGEAEIRTKKVKAKGRSHPRTGVWMHTMRKIMKDLGWKWIPTMRMGGGCTTHLISSELPADTTLIVRVSKHFTVVKDNVIMDTHDPSREGKRCVYGYWIKQ